MTGIIYLPLILARIVWATGMMGFTLAGWAYESVKQQVRRKDRD